MASSAQSAVTDRTPSRTYEGGCGGVRRVDGLDLDLPDAVAMQLSELCENPDPEYRVAAATALLRRTALLGDWLSDLRRRSLRELREQGRSQEEIARIAGISRPRINRLLNSDTAS